MAVREAAALDARRGDAIDVARMHAVVDLLVAPVVFAGVTLVSRLMMRRSTPARVEFRQRIAPDVIELHRPRDRALTLSARST